MRRSARNTLIAVLPSSAAARRAGIILSVATLAVLIAFVTTFTFERFTSVSTGKRLFDIGGENNVPTWWNSTLLTLVALGALGASRIVASSSAPERRAWRVIAVAAAYLSIDETASLHEQLGDVVPSGFDPPTYAWVLPGAALAGIGSAVLVAFGRNLPDPTAGRLGLALVAYGAAAIGIEAFNGWVRRQDDDQSIPYAVGTLIEEAVEMGACVFAVTVIVDGFRWRRTDAGVLIGPARRSETI
jgi:hypothetical protein